MIRFFCAPKTRVLADKDSRSFTLKFLNWTNRRALGYDSLLILTYKLQCTSKSDALKWPVLKSDSSNSIVLTLNAGLLLSSAEFSFEIIIF